VDVALRFQVLLRDGNACVRCGQSTSRGRHSVHHRLLKSQGGTDDTFNLIVLCGSGTEGCHGEVHSRRADVGIPGGFIVPSWEDPETVPVTYHQLGRCLLTPEGERVQL
jgi:hypothetical protein